MTNQPTNQPTIQPLPHKNLLIQILKDVTCLCNLKVHYRDRRSPPLDYILIQMTPVGTLRSSGRYILFRISAWKFICISNCFHACCVPHPCYSLYFSQLPNVSIFTCILSSNSISDFFASSLGCSVNFLFPFNFLLLFPLRLFFLFYIFTFSLPLHVLPSLFCHLLSWFSMFLFMFLYLSFLFSRYFFSSVFIF